MRGALPEVLDWGRYQLVRDRNHADLIFLFSMNPYLGDYFTRDGPDRRPAIVDYTILTVIDGYTGEALWSSWKRWGYMLVSRASRALVRNCAWRWKESFTWIPNRPRDEKFCVSPAVGASPLVLTRPIRSACTALVGFFTMNSTAVHGFP